MQEAASPYAHEFDVAYELGGPFATLEDNFAIVERLKLGTVADADQCGLLGRYAHRRKTLSASAVSICSVYRP